MILIFYEEFYLYDILPKKDNTVWEMKVLR